LDRGVWFVEVANVQAANSQWYGASIIDELMGGPNKEDVLSLEQQINFIQENWAGISVRFGPSEWQHTSDQLSFLEEDRMRRRFPGLFSPPSQVN
jgi:hypothetical protein